MGTILWSGATSHFSGGRADTLATDRPYILLCRAQQLLLNDSSRDRLAQEIVGIT
jgi:hypothetical protein